MIRDFFLGLGAGIKRDPIIWLLIAANGFFGLLAYAIWFTNSPEEARKVRQQMFGQAKTQAARPRTDISIPQVRTMVAKANVNIRAAPDPTARVIATLSKGHHAVVTATGVAPLHKGQPWVQVYVGANQNQVAQEGYVWAPLLE